ncbi:MAG: hypothetical protein IJ654_02280 [Bacteroidales bacterium]|nr:hypothetical protein [Bacteroidales bacterium]
MLNNEASIPDDKASDLHWMYLDYYARSSESEMYLTVNDIPKLGEPVPIREWTTSRRRPRYYQEKQRLLDVVFYADSDIIREYLPAKPRRGKGDYHMIGRFVFQDRQVIDRWPSLIVFPK